MIITAADKLNVNELGVPDRTVILLEDDEVVDYPSGRNLNDFYKVLKERAEEIKEARKPKPKPKPIFADQIKVGDKIEYSGLGPRTGEIITVTAVREWSSEYNGHVNHFVTILGHKQDGSPFDYQSGKNLAWILHEAS